MSKEFTIPQNITLSELNRCLIECSNNLASVGRKVAEYKADVGLKQTAYKRELARAKVRHSSAKTATMQIAQSEIDQQVINKQDDFDCATALYTIALGELDGWNAQFVALRKIVEIKKLEREDG
jgi:hypothetical protein